MSLLNIFHLSYYFDNNTGSTFPGFWVVVGLLAVLLIASILIKKRPERLPLDKRVVYRITRIAFIFSWLMLLWLFFRYEGILYLSWRFWALVIVIWAIVEAILTYIYAKYELPKKKGSGHAKIEKDKYLKRFEGKGRKK